MNYDWIKPSTKPADMILLARLLAFHQARVFDGGPRAAFHADMARQIETRHSPKLVPFLALWIHYRKNSPLAAHYSHPVKPSG